jgi:uncharacterized protein YabE (DUF348 family)
VLPYFMNSLTKRSSTPRAFVIAAFSLLVIFIVIIFAVRTDAASTRPPVGERLITIHDRGNERSVLTHSTTLRAVFKEALIELDPNDRVEPGIDASLVASHYEVNVYRARPVTIIDGAIRQKVMSSYQTPKQIAEQANITLQDEDKVTMAASANMVADGAGVQLTISRATAFTLVLYGTKTTVYTQEKTVGDMLQDKNIVLGGNDTLNVPVTAKLQAGMVIELWRNGKQTATEEQDIAFETEKIKDADQPVGYHSVTTPGEAGKKTVTYEVEMKNGVQVNRVEIQSVVTKEPKKQVEVIGMKYSLPAGSHEDWMAAAGIAASDYGFVNYIVGHEGGWCPVRWQGDSGCVDHGEAPKGGGYGLVQATPGGKMVSAGGDWLTNPVTQLRWATSYAVGKYGSWEGAYTHWTVVHSW